MDGMYQEEASMGLGKEKRLSGRGVFKYLLVCYGDESFGHLSTYNRTDLHVSIVSSTYVF